MPHRLTIVLALAIALAFVSGASLAADEEVTLEGKVMCAKCALHEQGRTKCQNVLVVEGDGEDTSEYYYLTATDANKKFGEVCMATPTVRVTGTVEDKDGQKWLAATEIVRVEEQS